MAGPGGLGSGGYVTPDKMRKHWWWIALIAVLTAVWIYFHN